LVLPHQGAAHPREITAARSGTTLAPVIPMLAKLATALGLVLVLAGVLA
jgi:hypothetical protein